MRPGERDLALWQGWVFQIASWTCLPSDELKKCSYSPHPTASHPRGYGLSKARAQGNSKEYVSALGCCIPKAERKGLALFTWPLTDPNLTDNTIHSSPQEERVRGIRAVNSLYRQTNVRIWQCIYIPWKPYYTCLIEVQLWGIFSLSAPEW